MSKTTWTEIDSAFGAAIAASEVGRKTVYGGFIRNPVGPLEQLVKRIDIEWFGIKPLVYQDTLVLPPKPNLAVDTGLHITARRAFNIGGPPGPVDAGGVDNGSTAVAAGTSVFATTHFLRLFDATATYSTANKRVTGDYTITNSDVTFIHRRYGISNSTLNAAASLYSMLSGFILNFNSLPYSITVRSQSDYTGS